MDLQKTVFFVRLHNFRLRVHKAPDFDKDKHRKCNCLTSALGAVSLLKRRTTAPAVVKAGPEVKLGTSQTNDLIISSGKLV